MPRKGYQSHIKNEEVNRTDADDLIGRKVPRDGVALHKALAAHYRITGVSQVANFVFVADREDGPPLLVSTEPADLDMQTLRITDIRELD